MITGFFCAGFIFQKIGEIWYILSVQDSRFSDLKAAGGMSVDGEDYTETLHRELRQELGVQVLDSILVYELEKTNHIQYYFLVTKVSDLPALDEKRELRETKGGKLGDILDVRWRTLKEFSQRVYKGQSTAFVKAIERKAEIDPEFAMDNMKILDYLSR